ncbi:hypothetical protein B0H14DRAFT_2388631, partial [Mycena olivaceomarginata]
MVASGAAEGIRFSGKLFYYFILSRRSADEQCFSQPKGFSAKLRPAQVGAWVQWARSGKPDIQNVEQFASEWVKWWQESIPHGGKRHSPCRDWGTAWGALDLPGPNRFLNVLVCLKGWREQVATETNEWKEAVEDVTWVLRQM